MYLHLNVVVLAHPGPPGRAMQETLRNAIDEAGATPVRPDEAIGPGARRSNAVMRHIQEADLIIADTSQHSPNVLLELGAAMAHNKPMLLLVNSQEHIGLPSDLAGFDYLLYDPANLSEVSTYVKRYIQRLTARRTA